MLQEPMLSFIKEQFEKNKYVKQGAEIYKKKLY